MARVMVFVDGSWLYANTPRLADFYGKPNFQVDFGKLPAVLADAVREQLGGTEVDVVRTYLFGSYASNYDPLDEAPVQRRLDFYNMLREEYHFEVEVFPINYRGRRVRRADRDPNDTFEAREKCVDIALATSMLSLAATPFAYDIAIAVVGDQDFKPVLQHVRRLGKRVAIASITGSCAEELADPRDEARLKDFDVIWINDLLDKLERRFESHQLDCESPTHQGSRKVWTTFYPRRGQKFFCDECKAQFDRQRQEDQQQFVNQATEQDAGAEPLPGDAVGQAVRGHVRNIHPDKQIAFLRAKSGNDYYFHLTFLDGNVLFSDLTVGMALEGEVVRLPGGGRAGAVRNVRLPGA